MNKHRMLKTYGHKCTLSTKQLEEKFDIKYPKGHTLFLKIWYCIRKRFLISDFNIRASKFYRSEYVLYNQRKRHLQEAPNIIHPLSLFRRWWEIFMIGIFLVQLMFLPFSTAFSLLFNNKSRIVYWKDFPRIVLDVICLLDILINFSTGFYDDYRKLNVNNKDIARNYLNGYFIPDVLSSIPPLHSIDNNSAFHKKYPLLFYCNITICALKIFRIFSCIRYMNNMAKINNYKIYYTKIFLTIVIIVLLLHWMTCVSIIVGILSADISHPDAPEHDSWITIDNLWNSSTEIIYFTALYRTTCIVSHSEFDLISDNTLADMVLVCVIWLAAKILYFFLAIFLVQISRSITSSESKYKEMMSQLLQYMHHKQLSTYTQNRLISYYEFRFPKIYFREEEIFNTVSGPIRQEILMLRCMNLVKNVPFFIDLPQSVMLRIVMALELEVFLADDVIFKAHLQGKSMYFIVTGTVAIYSKNGIEVFHLHDGDYFGDVGFILTSQVSTVIAIEPCELYRLDSRRFLKIMQPYPELLRSIENEAFGRLSVILSADEKYQHFKDVTQKSIFNISNTAFQK